VSAAEVASLVDLAARRLLSDIKGIINRDGPVLQRFRDIEDRVHAAEREMEAARQGVHAALIQHVRNCRNCDEGAHCEVAHQIAAFWTAQVAA
jgi:hypothetical protein